MVLDLQVFFAAQKTIFVRRLIDKQPRHHPHQAYESDEHEAGAPSVGECEVGYNRRSESRSEGRAGVEDADDQRALAGGKPFGSGFGGSRPVSRLAEAEQEAGSSQRPFSANEPMQHGGQRPGEDEHGESGACAEAVDDVAGAGVHDGVGQQKGGDHEGVILLGHGELFAQVRGDHREGQAVGVIDARGEEEHDGDDPA